MKHTKKIIGLALCIALTASFAACGKSAEKVLTPEETTAASTTTAEDTTEGETTTADGTTAASTTTAGGTTTAATTTKGEQLHIKMGAHLPEPQSWAFMMKDGDARIIIVVPRGQVTTLDTITFSANSAVSLPITITCLDDGTGESIHIFVDDGITSS